MYIYVFGTRQFSEKEVDRPGGEPPPPSPAEISVMNASFFLRAPVGPYLASRGGGGG